MTADAQPIGYYGPYGGRYVPETLVPALEELERGWRAARDDPTFWAELDELQRVVRRPPDADHARRAARARQADLPEARGPLPHRRAQDQQHARAGAARPAAREEAHHRRDRRGPARRRDRDGLREVRPRMRRLHGRRGRPPPAPERRADAPARRRGPAGRARDEDAQGGDERGDPRLDHERRDDLLPDRLVRRARTRTRSSCASSRR